MNNPEPKCEQQERDGGGGASFTLSDLQREIEGVAEQYVLLEFDNRSGLTQLSQSLQKLRAAFLVSAFNDLPGRAQCAAALEAAVRLVDSIARGDCGDPVHAFALVGRTLLALQKVGPDGNLAQTEFPPELAMDLSAGVPAGERERNPPVASPAKSVSEGDGQILKMFLDQELTNLASLEDNILALEKNADGKALAELKRTLHTMKGEAGVVGAGEIASVCHKLEDYLSSPHQTRSTELLMEIRDWLEQAVRAFSGGVSQSGSEAVIAKLSAAETAACPPPTAEGHAPAGATEAPPAVASAVLPGIEISDKDLAREFVAEAQEYFESADQNLLILENDPGNADAIGAVFRAFHTIKGVVGFLGLKPIADLAHQAETLLDIVRNGKKPFAGSVVEATFRGLDMLKTMVADVNQAVLSGSVFSPRPELRAIITCLQDVIAGRESVAAEKIAGSTSSGAAVKTQPDQRSEGGSETVPEDKPTSDVGAAIKQAVKIDADRLDLLIDTIGELVIAESMVTQDREIKGLRSLRVEKNMAHLGKITRMLQDMSMSMRMVPIEATFRKMTRLVRDLAKKADKRVELTLIGKETELDRAMVDKLNDPLVHMIRNSVDHGIEPEADRIAAGKPPVGHITLKAYHRGGNIHIEVTDDGKGLDREAILAKGIERGLIRAGQNPADKEIYTLIFEPGFSTAKQITEISGRGVGMDVVRRNLDSLRGNVLIDTARGRGSTFTLVLPLTTAIIDGIMVQVGRDTYIIPTLSIVESFKPTSDMLSTVIGRGEMIRFRDSLLPLFRLSRLFAIGDAVQEATRATVVVVEDNDKQTAILVDELLGQQQTVIKSLGEAVGTVTGVSGASILADGRPGLILDVGGIVKLAVGETKR